MASSKSSSIRITKEWQNFLLSKNPDVTITPKKDIIYGPYIIDWKHKTGNYTFTVTLSVSYPFTSPNISIPENVKTMKYEVGNILDFFLQLKTYLQERWYLGLSIFEILNNLTQRYDNFEKGFKSSEKNAEALSKNFYKKNSGKVQGNNSVNDKKPNPAEAPKSNKAAANNNSNAYFPSKANVAKNSKIKKGEESRCMKLHKFKWQEMSCYMDSLMFALFAFPSSFVQRYILEDTAVGADADTLGYLRTIYNSRQGANSDCNNRIRNSMPDFQDRRMGDPSEFLRVILDRLIILNTTSISAKTTEEIKVKPVIKVSVTEEMPTNLSLDDVHTTEFTYETTATHKTNDNFIAIDINRQEQDRAGKIKISNKQFEFEENITIENSDGDIILLPLTSVIFYSKRHYTCYFLCNGSWYLYDDTGPSITKIGNFAKMKKEAGKGCVLLLYNDSDCSV